jgi:hypothetical protein
MTTAQARIIELLEAILAGGGGGGGGAGAWGSITGTLSDQADLQTSLDAKALKTVAAKYRIKTDGTFQLWNPDISKFHTLSLSGADGAVTIDIAAGEA